MQVIQQMKVTAHAQASSGGLCNVPAVPRSHPPYSPRSPQKGLCSFGTIWIDCLEMWASASKHGGRQRSRVLRESFSTSAKQENLFIGDWARRHKQAYDKCYHPAMQSDYFRLCYILVEGGCYIDADDVYAEGSYQHLFSDGRLKIQPLCYDMATNFMVPPSIFAKSGANAESWIFYFNNNPLIAGSGHPLIERALAQATLSLEKDVTNGLPEIQSTTGPGISPNRYLMLGTESGEIEQALLVLCDWENIAKSRW